MKVIVMWMELKNMLNDESQKKYNYRDDITYMWCVEGMQGFKWGLSITILGTDSEV